jgi:FtsP/CotA-like multicopper oxidase with cupredoxin domain
MSRDPERKTTSKVDAMAEGRKGIARREFLKAAGLGAAGTVAVGGLLGSGLGARLFTPPAFAATTTLGLAATDGYMTAPGRDDPDDPLDPLYIFGFIPVPTTGSASSIANLISTYKGHAQTSAPTLNFRQNDDIKITLTNLGLVQRPDLTDSHTIHWHGFDLPSPLNDGVPEVSVAVPIAKQLTYFYRPHREGTYMYHCHFEDVEHVHMGMQGIVFVRPTQDATGAGVGVPIARQEGGAPTAPLGYAYNDGNGSTAYDRHFALLMNEVWDHFHDGDRDIQESIPTNYDPQWFSLNGRCYPQTVLPNDYGGTSSGLTTPNPNYEMTPDKSQPNSSLIQVKQGDRALLRLANLEYRQNAMELPGIRMHVIGQDASLLRNGGVDTSYWTNTIYMGPGEARDVLFTAPGYDALRPGGPASGSLGPYNVYYFKNRDWTKLSNLGAPGPGGMMTEVRVYPSLPAQTIVSQTYV